MPRLTIAVLTALVFLAAPPADASQTKTTGRVLFSEDFDDGGLDGWTATDSDAWRIEQVSGRGGVLSLHRQSEYEPEVRSPFNIILADDFTAASFVLELDVRSTTEDYNHRDLCLFFNHRDPSHFYYVHLGKRADPHANSIFVVDGEPRVSIAEYRTDGTDWDDNWHHVKIVRDHERGSIRVYWDDMDEPVMTATDTRFGEGRIGVGSFDDTGWFDNITVRALR